MSEAELSPELQQKIHVLKQKSKLFRDLFQNGDYNSLHQTWEEGVNCLCNTIAHSITWDPEEIDLMVSNSPMNCEKWEGEYKKQVIKSSIEYAEIEADIIGGFHRGRVLRDMRKIQIVADDRARMQLCINFIKHQVLTEEGDIAQIELFINKEVFNYFAMDTNELKKYVKDSIRATLKDRQKSQREKEAFDEIDLESVIGRNMAYHKFAAEYLKDHIVKCVAGGLRIYQNGVYISGIETESIMKRDIMSLALNVFGTPLSEPHVKHVIKVIEMQTVYPMEQCEPDSNKVILANNKIIDLETMETSDFDPEKVYFSKMPVDYNPEAPVPAMFTRYLDTTFRDNETSRMVVQELAGYLLARHYKYQHIFYLLGDGGEGKGVYIKILNYLLGSDNISSFSLFQLTDDSTVSYNIAGMHGKQANICGDVGTQRVKNTEHIKKLSSGTDKVSGRHPYGRPFEFINVAKVVFLQNKLAKKDAATTGDKRRDFVITFGNRMVDTESEIKDLATIIFNAGEMPGILNWAIEGLKRLEANGKFTGQKSIEERGLEVHKKSNPMMMIE
jgi:putative DNA primase/helicase